MWRQGRQVSMHVARGSTLLLSSHGRGLGPQDALKKDSRGLSRVWQVNLGSLDFNSDLSEFLLVPLRSQGYCGFGRGVSGLHWVWCN